ncbi:MAG: hypothetical protein Q8L08_09885 [Candidatus Nanopelagicaceae bacterium]|nr:hypothetical protein [Candidatus Nanopelagicaceae bacterium]
MTSTASTSRTSSAIPSSRSGPLGKAVAALVMLMGAGLIAITLISNLFAVGPAFENLIVDFRPALTQSAIDTARSDIAGLSAVQSEFTTKLAPALSQQLKMTPEQFNGFVSQNFPAVAAGMSALPTVVPTFNGLINTLDEQRPLFASADAIPTENLPATTVPWAMFGAGLLVFLIGLLMLRSPKTGGVAAIVMGLLLLLMPLALSLPAKAADADQLNANLKPVYTQELVTNATGALSTVGAMGSEMQTAMLPALATQLKMSPDQLQTFLGTNFPATAQALQAMPASMERFNGLVKVFAENLANYNILKPAGLANLILILMVAGGLVAGLGALTVLKRRRN